MTGYKAYQGNQVQGSGPLGLVLLTYEALYKALGRAERAIEAGDLAAEAESTSRALEAIVELSTTLNMEEGGEVAKNLASIYNYMFKRLTENMCSSSSEHVKEVMGLVQTLREGWQQLARDHQKEIAAHANQSVSRTQSAANYDTAPQMAALSQTG
ncbi:MAG: flagellar export chaperone FliS [Mariprofundaceae bacterium]